MLNDNPRAAASYSINPARTKLAAFAVSQIAPEKVLLGLASSGFDWPTTSGGARDLGWLWVMMRRLAHVNGTRVRD